MFYKRKRKTMIAGQLPTRQREQFDHIYKVNEITEKGRTEDKAPSR